MTCSKKLIGSQLRLPHGMNKKLKCETKNKLVSMIGAVQLKMFESLYRTHNTTKLTYCCA